MKRFKALLAGVVAVLAFSATMATSAQAGTGTITSGGSCDVIFTSGTVSSPDSAHPSWDHGQELSTILPDPTGACPPGSLEGDLHLHWMNSGQAQVIGGLSAPGPFGSCTYGGTLNGIYSGGIFTLYPWPQTISLTSGFVCPGSMSITTHTSFTP
ncbi:MAG: hypothetical protein J0H98_05520 [Solirubrobacterales bacterium]|nr:hypothetical protein [Solirubrobacterales bacterium]